VVDGLEETRTQLLLVTEPIFASAADLLAKFQTLPPAAAAARGATRLSELEIKAGLLQARSAFLPAGMRFPACILLSPAPWETCMQACIIPLCMHGPPSPQSILQPCNKKIGMHMWR
jgi:hypothetical protein